MTEQLVDGSVQQAVTSVGLPARIDVLVNNAGGNTDFDHGDVDNKAVPEPTPGRPLP